MTVSRPTILFLTAALGVAVGIPRNARSECSSASRMIDGRLYYEAVCACANQTYPTLDAALHSFDARVRSTVGRGRSVNDRYYWACAVSMEWSVRPPTVADCYNRMRSAQLALQDANAKLPEMSRPDVTMGLTCTGYDKTAIQGELRSTASALTKDEKIRGALERLSDPSKSERDWDVAWVDLNQVADPVLEVKLDDVTEKLKNDLPEVRKNAAHVIGLIGKYAKDAIPDLLRAINDKDKSVRLAALRALGAAGAGDPTVVPVLDRRLSDPDNDIVEAAAIGLGAVGVAAEKSVPDLIVVLHSTLPERTRERARDALREIGTPQALAAVQR